MKKGHRGGLRYFHLAPKHAVWAPEGGIVLSMSEAHQKRLFHIAHSRGQTMEAYLKTPTTMTWLTRPGHGEPTVKEDLKGRITITTNPQDSTKIQRLAKVAGHTNVCQWFISRFTAEARRDRKPLRLD